jgi:hypothetical protein
VDLEAAAVLAARADLEGGERLTKERMAARVLAVPRGDVVVVLVQREAIVFPAAALPLL